MHIGHLEVHEHNIRPELEECLDAHCTIYRLTHDTHVGLVRYDRSNSLTEDWVIIDSEDSYLGHRMDSWQSSRIVTSPQGRHDRIAHTSFEGVIPSSCGELPGTDSQDIVRTCNGLYPYILKVYTASGFWRSGLPWRASPLNLCSSPAAAGRAPCVLSLRDYSFVPASRPA